MSKTFVYIKVSQTSSYRRQHLLVQRCFTCVLTLCCFCWKLEKKATDGIQQSAPFSIFLSNICYPSKGRDSSMLCVKTSTFREERIKVCASINFSFSLYGWLM